MSDRFMSMSVFVCAAEKLSFTAVGGKFGVSAAKVGEDNPSPGEGGGGGVANPNDTTAVLDRSRPDLLRPLQTDPCGCGGGRYLCR